jgi:hypothetical protein
MHSWGDEAATEQPSSDRRSELGARLSSLEILKSRYAYLLTYFTYLHTLGEFKAYALMSYEISIGSSDGYSDGGSDGSEVQTDFRSFEKLHFSNDPSND